MHPCLIIPFYNHGQFAAQLVRELTPFALPVIIVDDGSDEAHKEQLNQAISGHKNITLITLKKNGGKGHAVITGFQKAYDLGYSHAIQIDADCQHDFAVITPFLRTAEENPDALICGYPIYDKTVPKSRLYPRYITHFWVCVNTLSNDIKDSMCGFRCYPLGETLAMLDKQEIGLRMDFDIEIVVRLYWRGMATINLPVGVIYHDDASSHFRLWKDNVLISRAHTVLFFGMLKRLPKRLLRGKFA